MKSFTARIRQASLVVMALSALGGYQSAFAAVGETTAGTDITNIATVNYQVGGVSQTPVSSNPATATFKVDRKVIFTVSELSGGPTTPVAPGQTNVVTSFTVANTGNAAEGFQLTASNLTGGTVFGHTDNRDMSNLRVFVDANGNNTYDPGVDIATTINTLARDATVTVFVVADAPAAAVNGDYSNIRLTARAAVAGTSGATLETESASESAGTVDVVIADAGRDNTEAADDEYAFVSANLSVAKTVAVVSDPFNNTTNPKAIPGATVRYTMVVTNSGSTSATSVTLTDAIPTNTSYVTNSTKLNTVAQTDNGPVVTTTGTPVTSLSINVGTVSNGGTATVTFDVKIN